MSQNGMQKLAEDNLISDVKLEKCTNYLADKQNQTAFRTRPPMRHSSPLELVHSDVCPCSIVVLRDVHR